MLSSSYIHIRGIGPTTEQRIWQRGVRHWEQFLANPTAAGLGLRKRADAIATVTASLDHLQCRDHRFFSAQLPPREHWRTYREFSQRIAFLDIETTGMSDEEAVTMIGVYDGTHTRTYVKGIDLQDFMYDIDKFHLLVTYFGAGFDLPFLRRRFPMVPFDQLHIDLCPALHRLGYKGGLKHIEEVLGISRAPETQGLSGWDAVRLWREYQYGSAEALALLTAYNTEDIVNLETLLEFAYPKLRTLAGFPDPVAHSSS